MAKALPEWLRWVEDPDLKTWIEKQISPIRSEMTDKNSHQIKRWRDGVPNELFVGVEMCSIPAWVPPRSSRIKGEKS